MYKCRINGLTMAVKKVAVAPRVPADHVNREVQMLNTLRHAHIVDFLGELSRAQGWSLGGGEVTGSMDDPVSREGSLVEGALLKRSGQIPMPCLLLPLS